MHDPYYGPRRLFFYEYIDLHNKIHVIWVYNLFLIIYFCFTSAEVEVSEVNERYSNNLNTAMVKTTTGTRPRHVHCSDNFLIPI